jgi:VanZ family protein
MAAFSSRRFYMWLSAAVLWMAVIFYKSAETYQQQSLLPLLTEKISAATLSKWLPHLSFTYDHALVTWQEPYAMLEFFIRKGGHVVEYAILCLLLGYALLAKPMKKTTAIFWSALLSILYAASDEWHQSFIPGRTGHAIDVAMDTIGVLLAVGWLYVVRRRRRIR